MNKVILIGRLVKDPMVKTTQSQVAVCSFTIAVDRRVMYKDGSRPADFITCVAWRQHAEFLGRYFQKGSRIAIVGNIQSRSYDDPQGKKVYVTEIVVDEIEFVDTKREGDGGTGSGEQRSTQTLPAAPEVDSGFYPTMDDDTTLPFDL